MKVPAVVRRHAATKWSDQLLTVAEYIEKE